jgi:hypothetical protein
LRLNVETIQDPMSLVEKLHGKTFDWIDNKKNKNIGHKQYGFVAQDVAIEFPTLVSTTLNDHLSVDYSKVVSILVEAVKSIQITLQNMGIYEKPDVPYKHQSTPGPVDQINTPTGKITIHQRPVPGHVETNIVAFGNIDNIIKVSIATTPNDELSITEIFDTGHYILYTNRGLNTIDDVYINQGDTILIKDSLNKIWNGIYNIISVQEGPIGKFSRIVRHNKFKFFSDINGSTVIVEPNGFAGNGKGLTNTGYSYICTQPSNDPNFEIDESQIDFISITQQQYGSISLQNKDNVNITGGDISISKLQTHEIHPLHNDDVSVILESSLNQSFNVKNDSGLTMCSIDHNGKVSASDFYSPSDQKLKTNISDISDALSLVNKLHGVTFDWNDSTKNHETSKQYGFIAQEVGIHFPTLVHERSDGKLSVDYSKVVSILVEAVKDIGHMLNI